MVCHGQLKPQPLTLEQQRLLFIQTETALKEGDLSRYHAQLDKLRDYPLYPNLLYQALEKSATIPEVEKFLTHYPDTLLSQRLRKKQLLALAQQENWDIFLQLYEPTDNKEINCYHYYAKQQSEGYAKIQDDVRKLWLQAKSQPEPCDLIFSVLLKQDPKRNALVWERFKLSLEKYQFPLAQYLLTLLPPNEQKQANPFISVYRFPTRLKKILNHHPQLKNDPDFLSVGLTRLARKHPDLSQKIWHSTTATFTEKQQHMILTAISKGFKRKKAKTTPQWLDQLAINIQDPAYLGWKAEAALYQQQWDQVLHWIDQLHEDDAQLPKWQYWYARSLKNTQQPAKAQKLFEKIAQSRNYYGFLAAVHSQQPFPIKHQPQIIDEAEKQRLKEHINFRRVAELYHLERFQEGNRQWWFFINRLNQSQRYIAIHLAKENGWDRLALATTTKLSYKDDLTLRFPVQYKDIIIQQAKNNHLNPALVFALIRQESLFRENAVSHAGARGLMQLMPYTAKRVAQQLDLHYNDRKQLFDPTFNVTLGSHYLGKLSREKGHPILAIASYNAGPHRINRWLSSRAGLPADLWVEAIPFKETREYVKHVVTYSLIYDYLLGNQPVLNQFMFHIEDQQ